MAALHVPHARLQTRCREQMRGPGERQALGGAAPGLCRGLARHLLCQFELNTSSRRGHCNPRTERK